MVPKKEPGKFRLIHDLSFPKHASVNDGIPIELRSVNYEPFDKAIAFIMSQGSNVTISKLDIQSAFRICPVHPADRHLLGLEWKGEYYFDKTLAMGLASSCKIFECVSSALKWIALKNLRNVYIAKVLDDFLLITAAGHPCPDLAFKILQALFKYVGVPLAEEKSVAPCKRLTYLGLEIDVDCMCVRLPMDKVQRCTQAILALMSKTKARVREVQSLCGLLQFACRAVVPGRPFLRRLYDLTKGIGNTKFFVRISLHVKQDLGAWLNFLSNYNGRTMFLPLFDSAPQYVIRSDASQSVGYGAVCGDLWLFGSWPTAWKNFNIIVLELGPIVIALATWATLFENKSVHILTDNLSLVSVINKQSTADPILMFLVRKMVMLLLKHNIWLKASHIAGHDNSEADALSRGRIDLFQVLHPSAVASPSTIPPVWNPDNWGPPSLA